MKAINDSSRIKRWWATTLSVEVMQVNDWSSGARWRAGASEDMSSTN